ARREVRISVGGCLFSLLPRKLRRFPSLRGSSLGAISFTECQLVTARGARRRGAGGGTSLPEARGRAKKHATGGVKRRRAGDAWCGPPAGFPWSTTHGEENLSH